MFVTVSANGIESTDKDSEHILSMVRL